MAYTRKKTILLIGVILFALFQPCPSGFAQGKEIVVAADEEKRGGYLVEITVEAFKRVGYRAEVVFLPWARALKGSMEGQYDVLMAAYHTDERAEKLAYSEPIGKVEVYLLKRKGSDIAYNTVEDLKPYRIGHIRSSSVSREFDEAAKKYLTIVYAADTAQTIGMLLRNRLDLVVEKKQRILHLLQTEFQKDADKVEFVYPPLKTGYFYNTFPKKLPGYQQKLDDFNRGLKIIKEDGTETAILKRHKRIDNNEIHRIERRQP